MVVMSTRFPKYIKPRLETKIDVDVSMETSLPIGLTDNPLIYATRVAYRTGRAFRRAQQLKQQLVDVVPEGFSINVRQMEDALDVLAALKSVGIDRSILIFHDIVTIYEKYKESIKKIGDINSLYQLTKVVNLAEENIDMIPSLSVWEYLVSSIRKYLWFPKDKIHDYQYIEAARIVGYYLIASDMTVTLSDNITSIIDIYSLVQSEDDDFKPVTVDMMQEVINGNIKVVETNIELGNKIERSIGDLPPAKTKYIHRFPFEDQISVLEEALLCYKSAARAQIRELIDPGNLTSMRNKELDDKIASRTNTLRTKLSMRLDSNKAFKEVDISTTTMSDMTDAVYNTLGSNIENFLGAGPDCIINTAINKWRQSGTIETLIDIRDRLGGMLGILRAGQALKMANSLGQIDIWNNLQSIGQNIIRRVIVQSLQSVVSKVRLDLSMSVGGLRVDNDILQCMGFGTLVNETIDIGGQIIAKYQNELSSLMGFNKSKGSSGLQMLESLNTQHASNKTILFIEDVIGTLNSIIDINGISVGSTIDNSSISDTVDIMVKDKSKKDYSPIIKETPGGVFTDVDFNNQSYLASESMNIVLQDIVRPFSDEVEIGPRAERIIWRYLA